MKSTTQSASAQLLSLWCQSKQNNEELDDKLKISMVVSTRAPLAGAELEQFVREEDRKRKDAERVIDEAKVIEEMEKARAKFGLGDDLVVEKKEESQHPRTACGR